MSVTLPTRAAGLARFAGALFIYTLGAVGWGAIVRATGSGDGCGNNWPLCNGEVLPVFESNERLFEFTHRASTGLILPLAVALVVWARRVFPKFHFGRAAAWGALFMTVLEALIGAALVKMGWVDQDSSGGRVLVMGFHTVSTFVLMGFIAAVVVAARGGPQIKLKGQGAVLWMLLACLGSIAALGISGAISALGHQLWPTDEVLRAASDPASHWTVRAQPTHPFLASTVGLLMVLTVALVVHLRPSHQVRRASRYVVGAFGANMLLGLINIWLKAPFWMQAAHLMVADLTFAAFVILALAACAEGLPRKDASERLETAPELSGRELVSAYVAITKPRVISLLLFTTLAAAFAAAGGWPGWMTLAALTVGGYLSAGAANAINMVIDRDIDVLMSRTSSRPTVTEAIPSTNALYFAGAIAWAAFAILWLGCNLLTAMLAMAGLVFYVVVYTLLLKRRTWQNIVIGGAAGAFPPLVGWAAVAGNLSPLAIYLFAIIFVWTPVHFWALALLIKEEYERARVPMLPVVRGDRYTARQIALYALVTVALTAIPFAHGVLGAPYIVAAALLNAGLVAFTLRLHHRLDRVSALYLFKYSMVYLAALFLMVAVDRAVAA